MMILTMHGKSFDYNGRNHLPTGATGFPPSRIYLLNRFAVCMIGC